MELVDASSPEGQNGRTEEVAEARESCKHWISKRTCFFRRGSPEIESSDTIGVIFYTILYTQSTVEYRSDNLYAVSLYS